MPALMMNGVNYSGAGGGGNANEQVLTWAEYCALTPEEKMNDTTYYINDINGDGQSFQPIIYSPNEREVGVWTDGKPIYERTFIDITLTADQDYTLIASGIERIVSAEHCVINTSNNIARVPFYVSRYGASGNMSVSASLSNGQMFVTNNTSNSVIWSGTIRYTKTTDQPGSGTWTPQGVPAVHYDGNEKVVGTWFGETLYEKTVTFTAPSNSYITVATNITNFDKCIGYTGIVMLGGGLFEDINYSRPDSSISTYYTAITADGGIFFRTYEATTGTVYITIRYTKSTS